MTSELCDRSLLTNVQVLGIPVGSTLQSAVKQVAISSGQILVAKSSPAASKVMAQKQVVAQGVAKAIVSSGGGGGTGSAGGGASCIVGQQVHTVTKAAGGSSGSGKSGGEGSRSYCVPFVQLNTPVSVNTKAFRSTDTHKNTHNSMRSCIHSIMVCLCS